MTDPGGSPRHTLCFLSTLLSQKVLEQSDTVLRCIVSGQPKPEVTWYKNGQAIDDSAMVSSYEFFENQYIHLLHLPCCTADDAAVYQVSAKNCFGMICCSASVEVQCVAEKAQVSSNLENARDAGWGQDSGTCKEPGADQTDGEEYFWEEGGSSSRGTPSPTDSSPDELSCPHSLQLWAAEDTQASSSGTFPDLKDTRQCKEANNASDPESLVDGVFFPASTNTPEKQEVCCCQARHSRGTEALCSKLHTDGPAEEDSSSGLQQPRALKYISCSLPLSEVIAGLDPSASASGPVQLNPQASSEDSDSDYELCPEITLTCTEEFSDDDLEYLECSDVMTDYSNAVWQRKVQGTECVFLLESDDEEVEFSEHGLGGREPFPNVLGCGPRVSGDIGPMDATPGFCAHHSQAQGVGTRSSGASRPSPPALGPHPAALSLLLEQGSTPAPPAAPENEYTRIQGETRDSPEAEEELASDRLLTTEPAAAEMEPGSWTRGPGVMQCSGPMAEPSVGEKDSEGKRGSQKPPRMRQLGAKGRNRKLSANLPVASPKLLLPQQAVEHPPIWSTVRGTPHTRAGTADGTAHIRAGEHASRAQAEHDAKRLPTPAVSLPQGADASLVGEELWGDNPFATSQVPVHDDPLQVRSIISQLSWQDDELCSLTLYGVHKGSTPLAQVLEGESCVQSPQQEARYNREGYASRGSWKGLEHVLSVSEVSEGGVPPSTLSHPFLSASGADPRGHRFLSAASPEATDTALTLETERPGSVEGATCGTECSAAGGTMASVGALDGKYLPQEICSMDSELAEGQGTGSDLCPPDNRTLGVLFQGQVSEALQAPCTASPVLVSTFTWTLSRENSEVDAEDNLGTVEKSISALAPTVQAAQDELSPSTWQGFDKAQPLPSEDNSWMKFEEEGHKNPSGNDQTTPACHSSCMEHPQEMPSTSPANAKGHPPTAVAATKHHVVKYCAMSIAENDHTHGAQKTPLEDTDERTAYPPSHGQATLAAQCLTNALTLEQSCMVASVPGVQGHVPQLPEGAGVCSHAPLHVDGQSGEKHQTTATVDNGRLEDNFQERGSETKWRHEQESLLHPGSLSVDDFQGAPSIMSVAQEETPMMRLDHSPANSSREGWQSPGLGTSGSGATEATVKAPSSQALSTIPSLADILLELPGGAGLGGWEAGRKLKIITLEASLPESWPPRQVSDSEYPELDVSPQIPNQSQAAPHAVGASVVMSELDPSATAAVAHQPRDVSSSVLANNRDLQRGEGLAGSTQWGRLPSQYSSQPQLLESSVDPVDNREVCVRALLSEVPETGAKEHVSHVSRDLEETQLRLARSAVSFQRLLSCPGILESSVDPMDVSTVLEHARTEGPKPSEATQGAVGQESEWNNGNLGQRVEVQPALLKVPHPQEGKEIIPCETSLSRDQGDGERWAEHNEADAQVPPAAGQAPRPDEGRARIPWGSSVGPTEEGTDGSLGGAEHSKVDGLDCACPALPLSSCPAVMMPETHTLPGQKHDSPGKDIVEPQSHQCAFSDRKERGIIEKQCEKDVPSPSDFTQSFCTLSPEKNITCLSLSCNTEELKAGQLQSGDSNPPNSASSPAMTLALVPREFRCESEKALQCPQAPRVKDYSVGRESKSAREAAQPGKVPAAPPAGPRSEEGKKLQEPPRSGHLTEGVKKKILSRVAALRLRLEEKENVRKTSSFLKTTPKPETLLSHTEEKKHPRMPPDSREGRAPVLLRKIQAEMFPSHSGNVKLSCQFAEIHEDSTIWWTKDSKPITQIQRSAGDNSTVSLAIVQASQKDQGLYDCSIENSHGKAAAQFNLTAAVLKQLSSHQNTKGCEEIEFSQLLFKEDFLSDSYFGGRLRGQIATEELHFGEGVHRKAFRSTVMRGLTPVFQPGHACVLKVHNAIAYGTRNNAELIQKNYRLAAQECYVQNTARHYAKIYAAEAQPLEGFGEVPEIIPIFLIHRPENNIPYATVEEELIGEFVKYSIRDGKEINFLRRESEAGQKCCTFQHWVYQKTSGCLLVTDMQGVGMKLTDVGIATLAKGYKGFKGNCSMTFIDQFKALHQCNKYCKMLGLKSLQNNSQKQRRLSLGKSKAQGSSTAARKPGPGSPAAKTT
ncbi:alpha-protein kinase 2 [Ochotona curzoniae]|uniref:alpha-protein kinase 2 n=1 Tax=Ochotona curzoniae TaxID=130825 RepID=UPI001B34EF92|nr:alpha-protein kinase 2 [Ochotona curzoniae]